MNELAYNCLLYTSIEGYITKTAWEMSDMFHLKAIEIISKNLRGAVANTPEGREGMALGQYIAGMGFSNVGLGIVQDVYKRQAPFCVNGAFLLTYCHPPRRATAKTLGRRVFFMKASGAIQVLPKADNDQELVRIVDEVIALSLIHI